MDQQIKVLERITYYPETPSVKILSEIDRYFAENSVLKKLDSVDTPEVTHLIEKEIRGLIGVIKDYFNNNYNYDLSKRLPELANIHVIKHSSWPEIIKTVYGKNSGFGFYDYMSNNIWIDYHGDLNTQIFNLATQLLRSVENLRVNVDYSKNVSFDMGLCFWNQEKNQIEFTGLNMGFVNLMGLIITEEYFNKYSNSFKQTFEPTDSIFYSFLTEYVKDIEKKNKETLTHEQVIRLIMQDYVEGTDNLRRLFIEAYGETNYQKICSCFNLSSDSPLTKFKSYHSKLNELMDTTIELNINFYPSVLKKYTKTFFGMIGKKIPYKDTVDFWRI